jgi:photosystem II stability/assembly factor-like uncharacterized protein
MDDQLLFEEFHAAYDFELRAGSFERLRATLVKSEVGTRRGIKFGFGVSDRSRRLMAAMTIVVLAIAAAGALIAIQQYTRRTVPVVPPPTRGCAFNQLLAYDSLLCSADDAAVRGQDEVFITHDGGRSWLSVKMPCCYTDSPEIGVRWIDSNNLVVIYGSHLIDVTTDGGIHWQVIRSGWAEGTNLPLFLNGHEGWQYGSSGLFHTTDGGAHWTAVSSFPSMKQFDWWADRLFFVDSENGFIRPSGYSQPWVTHDGGHSWSRALVSPPAPVSQLGNVPQGPFMFGTSGLIAFLNGGDRQGVGTTLSVYQTSDGGLKWSGPQSAPGLWLAPLDVNAWWVVDGEGHLARTSDGGKSWQRIQTDLAKGMALTSVTPVGDDVLWGVATNGYHTVPMPVGPGKRIPNLATVRSTDGGAHWSIVNLPG